MPTYVIHHKVDTLLELWEPFEFDGFSFSAWSINHESGGHDGWLAKKELEAGSVDEAFRQFFRSFYRLVNRIAFIGQCHTAADLETFVITKPGDKRFFWRFARKRNPVPLAFTQEKVLFLSKLEEYKEEGDVFHYMKEATNASSFSTMLAMLLSTLEAMAGHTYEKGRYKLKTDFVADEVLKDRLLCKRLFKHGEGIRQKLFHGGFIDYDLHRDTEYNNLLYNAIIEYFNSNYGLEIGREAKATPRKIIGNYEHWFGWCEWLADGRDICLKLLFEDFRTGKHYRSIGGQPIDF